MKKLILILAFVLALSSAFILQPSAFVACPESEPGYVRQYRPAGEPPNYPPLSEPACLYYITSGEQP